MTIGDLTYSLGAVWDKASLKNIKDGLAEVSKTFVTAVGVAGGALAGVFGAVKAFAGANDELGKLAKNRDIAVGSLQALQYSFEGAGVEASKVGDVLDKLQEQKGKFSQGTADNEAFARIGINPNAYKDNESFFNATLDGLKNIKDEAVRADLSKRLLGSADLNNLIDGGSEAIKAQKKELKELGVLIDEKDYKKSAKFNDTLLKTTTILKGLLNRVMMKIVPIFTRILEDFNAFIGNNRGLINWLQGFFEVLVKSLQFVFSLIGRVIGQILSFKPALIAIAGLLVLWQLPLILTIGAVISLFVLLDELFSFLNNEDSLIGDWLGVSGVEEFKTKFPKITATFKAVADTIEAIFTALKDTFINLWDMLTGKISFGEMLQNQITIVGDLLGSLKDIFMRFVDWLVGLFASKFPTVTAIFKSFSDTILSILTYLKDTFINLWDMLTGKISFGEMLQNQITIVGDLLGSLKDIFMRFVDWLIGLFDSLDIFGGIKKQIDKVKNVVSNAIPDVSNITKNIKESVSNFMPELPTLDGALSFMGFGGNEKQAVPAGVTPNGATTTTNNYHYAISADVNATNKNISEALTELTNPAGY